jgi:hypothetical protein
LTDSLDNRIYQPPSISIFRAYRNDEIRQWTINAVSLTTSAFARVFSLPVFLFLIRGFEAIPMGAAKAGVRYCRASILAAQLVRCPVSFVVPKKI